MKKKMYLKTNKELYIVLYTLLIATLLITICSKSSFLYPINDWADANCLFTTGKAMINGKVLYQDIYEQKGPLLYFIHGVACLISDKSFFGIYLVEIICFSIFLFLAGACFRLYVKNTGLTLISISVLAFLILISRAFGQGDSAEEICLAPLMYGLYSVLSAVRERRLLRRMEVLVNGIGAAFVLWIKYTMLGFYIGLIIFVLLWYFMEKSYLELGKVVIYFSIGAGIASAPILVYFVFNNAIPDLYEVYFYNNMFLYSYDLEQNRIITIIYSFRDNLQNNLGFVGCAIVGIIWMAMKEWKESFSILFSFLGLTFFVYYGGRAFVYYGLIFAIYSIFGLAFIGNEILVNKKKIIYYSVQMLTLFLIMLNIVLCVGSYLLSNNTYLMQFDKAELPQYKFATYIKDDASLLNYGFLDGGFYLAADIIPEEKYFCTLNIHLEEMVTSQNECVEQGRTDFIVTRDTPLENYEIDSSKYELVEQMPFYWEGTEVQQTYYLYKKVNSSVSVYSR